MTAESSANWIPHSTNDRRSLVSHPLYTTSGGAAALSRTGIRSLAKVSNPVGPITYPVLYLRYETRNAAPKCISGRTSYHEV